MKKVILISAIVSLTLLACKTAWQPDSNQAVPSGFNPDSTISSAVAQAMVTHYLDPTVDHSLDSIIKQITLNNSDLYEIFKLGSKNNPVTRLRLLTAAYLDTDPIVARRNHKTILVQVKRGYNSTYTYYDITTFGAGRLCPPPMCDPIEQ